MTEKRTTDRYKPIQSLLPTIVSGLLAVGVAFGGSYVNTSVQVTELRVKVEMLERRETETREALGDLGKELKAIIKENHDDLTGEVRSLRTHLLERKGK